MKKITSWILGIVGVLVFGFIAIQLLSLFIYSQKNTVTKDSVGSTAPEYAQIPSRNAVEDSLVNNTEGSKVKKSGNIYFEVKDLDQSYTELEVLNGEYLAEVTNIYDSGKGNDRYLQVTVKVPVEKFDEYYSEVRAMDGEVSFANVNSEDVTEEYIDITSRLTNLKSVETQLVGILADAETVQDILAVQSELTKTRGEIERYEQQKRYFDSQADYAHLSIKFSIDKEGLSITDEEWKPLGEFRAALNSLVSVFKGLVNVTIWALVFSPIVLIPGGIVWLVSRKKSIQEPKA